MTIKYILIIIFMLALWLIDISVTAMNFEGVLYNGVWSIQPAVSYHAGLIIGLMSFVILLFYSDFNQR